MKQYEICYCKKLYQYITIEAENEQDARLKSPIPEESQWDDFGNGYNIEVELKDKK